MKHFFFVGITIKKLWGYETCGGTLIAKDKVLTAAHCFLGVNIPARVLIKYGTKNRFEKVKEIKASKIVKHPKFKLRPKIVNDVAVVTLSEPIEEGPKVKYAKLQTGESKIGDKFTVYGWGRTKVRKDPKVPEPDEKPPRLLKANLTLVEIKDKELILKDPIQSGCKGDSGGPLVSSDGKVAGIVSWGDPQCRPGQKNMYTSVSAYIDWIKNN